MKNLDTMKAWRIILALSGVAVLGYGAFRLFTEIPTYSLMMLAVWLVGAIVIHDGLLSPVVLGVSVLLRRFVPDRARRYLQAFLIISAMVTVIAVWEIHLRGSQPDVKALLLRNYGANLALIIGVVGAVLLALYAVRVARDRLVERPPDT